MRTLGKIFLVLIALVMLLTVVLIVIGHFANRIQPKTVLTLRVGTVPPDSPLIVRYGARFVRRLLVRAYVRAYRRHRAVDTVALERWLTLRAVDRLADGIAEERTVLLAILERAMTR